MKLLDLLVKKTNEEGWRWPGKSTFCYQTKPEHGYITKFFDRNGVKIVDYCWEKCDDASVFNELTKEQYESALAASEDWIEWGGGECPVDEDTPVEVRFRGEDYGISVAIADSFVWCHGLDGGDIIAYRLHKPDINYRANDDRLEQDLNECIGQDVDMPEWNGEGLPPVGLICEGRFPRHPGISFEWQECLVLYAFERECAVKSKSTSTLHYCDEFRPLRTEAEKAREDAETAIRTCLAGTGAGITPLAAKGIYEAIADGKIPGVKLEGK